ncbi:hypothetical protein GCM10009122_13060 [Fulvivirga kasyanovii]|uniref:hypothetical protein n=1 Tax=Fulvivirga kasyanovii TaxID=396812 RepID=UPI0031DCA519
MKEKTKRFTDAGRKAFTNDRTNMQLQKKFDSNEQGGLLSNYSKQKKKEYNLDENK